jgi:hypothetical protein
MITKLINLVRNELILTKLNSYSLSREIGFPDRARIIEFGSKERGRGYNILWSPLKPLKCRLLAITLTRWPDDAVVDYN